MSSSMQEAFVNAGIQTAVPAVRSLVVRYGLFKIGLGLGAIALLGLMISRKANAPTV